MSQPNVLEVTITHNIADAGEVSQLLSSRLIALDWGRKGPDPTAYSGTARSHVQLFHRMKREGAAVIAAYKGATQHRSDRLVGWVEPDVDFVMLNRLLCLPLSRARVVDVSTSFLGNLPPRRCTVQTCHKRAKGRLAAFVLGTDSPRSIWHLHHHDVEWLVTNFLIARGICSAVWSGGRSFENIDHAGYGVDGREVLAQTTVSHGLVDKKAAQLLLLASPTRDLLFFGPGSSRQQCPPAIRYCSIEDVFTAIDATPQGCWLIDRMLSSDRR